MQDFIFEGILAIVLMQNIEFYNLKEDKIDIESVSFKIEDENKKVIDITIINLLARLLRVDSKLLFSALTTKRLQKTTARFSNLLKMKKIYFFMINKTILLFS